MNTISVEDHPNALLWFSTPACNVCKVLRPAVASMLQQEFPKMEFLYIDTTMHPHIAAQHQVFTAPVAIVHLDGKETMRWARGFGIDEIRSHLNRLYPLCFDE